VTSKDLQRGTVENAVTPSRLRRSQRSPSEPERERDETTTEIAVISHLLRVRAAIAARQ